MAWPGHRVEEGQRNRGGIMKIEDGEGGVLREENMSSKEGNILVWDQSGASVTPFLCNIL